MVTRKQSIDNFSAKMDELIGSSYILSDKKITNVLKAVTSSKLFFELTVFCNEGYSYEYARAQFDKSNSPFIFDDDKQLIAFGINLLARLDCKDEDLLAILSKNYGCDNFDKGYKQFASGFLTQFKQAMIKTANQMIEGIQSPAKEKREKVEVKENKDSNVQMTFSNLEDEDRGEIRKNYLTCFADIQQIIVGERNRILHCRIKEDEKSDLLNLLDAFKECAFMGNKEQIRMSFVSYKYAALSFKKLSTEVDDIERILKFCKIM